MKLFLVIALSIFASLAQAQIIEGQDRGNGGDTCELRIYQITSELKQWITQGGSAALRLPGDLTQAFYKKTMLEQMSTAIVSCTSDELVVATAEKTCMNFTDIQGQPRIVCNYSRFMRATTSDQYVLTHHEYAGLAKFEINNGAKSDYRISSQILGYFQAANSGSLDSTAADKCPNNSSLADSEKMVEAIYKNNLSCVKLLTAMVELNDVVSLSKIQKIDWPVKSFNFYKLPPLTFAAALGRVDAIKILLKAGADVKVLDRNTGYVPLTMAAKAGNDEVIKLLSQNGADIDSGPYNPIAAALSNIQDSSYLPSRIYSTVETLLDLGANPNAPIVGGMLIASAGDRSDLVDLLVHYGASPAAVNYLDQTPLYFCRSKACVDKFVSLGIDVNKVDHYRNRAIDVVQTDAAINALLSHGSRRRKTKR